MDVRLQISVPQLPCVAELAPHRSVGVGDARGRCEVFALDRSTGLERQVTDRPRGTTRCALTPDGERVWWFDDGPAGQGAWQVQGFCGGRTRRALPGVRAGRPAGLAMALDGTVAAGLRRSGRTTVHVRAADGSVRPVHGSLRPLHLLDLCPDGTFLAVTACPSEPDAVRILDRDGLTVRVLSGRSQHLWGLGFAPVGRTLLLVSRFREGYRLMTWDPSQGLRPVPGGERSTEITASWYPDGRRLLVREERHGRSRLWELDRRSGRGIPVRTPPGSLTAADVLPDGRPRYLWTDSLTPPCLMAGERTTPGPLAAPAPSTGRRAEDLWTDGPGGPVHALVTVPGRAGPHPTVFVVHGGPHEAARDAYDPLVDLLVRIGFAVVRVNYRGSTGYGPRWRRVEPHEVGFAQLEDLAAVRSRAVDLGLAGHGRTGLCGESWGGYLALLAAGTQPDLWLAAAALSPVADYVAAHRDTTAPVRALDRALLGGSPRQVPERYVRASPITYVDRVRAPVLVVAGRQDVKCPPAQIRSYVRALRAAGAPCRLVWTDGGHDPAQAGVRVQALRAAVHFLGRSFGGTEETTSPTGGGDQRVRRDPHPQGEEV